MKKTTSNHQKSRKNWSQPNPTCPVIISRVPIYAPILRNVYNSPRKNVIYRYKNKWGIVDVEGKPITQEHRAILDVAKKIAKKTKKYNTGAWGIFFNVYELKKKLGYEGGSGNKRFIQRLEDMRRNKLTIQTKEKIAVSGIIDYYDYENKIQNIEGINLARLRQDNCTFEIRFSPNYMQTYKICVRAHYDDLIEEILKIKDGTIQAIIHFFLTHKSKCRYEIKQVLQDIAAITDEISDRQIEKLMRKPIEYKVDLENFGIIVEEETKTLYYKRNPKVFFSNPPKTSKPKTHQE